VIEKIFELKDQALTRKEACQLIGNIITPKTLRNLDCLKKGPKNKFYSGKKVFYTKEDFKNWFLNYEKDLSQNLHRSTRSNQPTSKKDSINIPTASTQQMDYYPNNSNSISKLNYFKPVYNATRLHG
jgi:hypothetical protein